ncbi:hypothetical protein VULLAG_LOCUS21337 [Vulpes lagopus]
MVQAATPTSAPRPCLVRGEWSKHTEESIATLSKWHQYHIRAHDPKGGLDNARHLTGFHETSNHQLFHWRGQPWCWHPHSPDCRPGKEGLLRRPSPLCHLRPLFGDRALILTCLLNETGNEPFQYKN